MSFFLVFGDFWEFLSRISPNTRLSDGPTRGVEYHRAMVCEWMCVWRGIHLFHLPRVRDLLVEGVLLLLIVVVATIEALFELPVLRERLLDVVGG